MSRWPQVQGTYETKIMGSETVRTGILMATQARIVSYAKKLGGYDFESFPSDIAGFTGPATGRWKYNHRTCHRATTGTADRSKVLSWDDSVYDTTYVSGQTESKSPEA